MSLRRSIIAISPLLGLLVFVACSDQDQPKGVTIPPDTVVPDAGKPTTDETENPDGTATKHLCKVQKKGSDASKVITGTLLLPSGPKAGELFVTAEGVIACADASCSKTAGYDKATKIECTSVAISPGLINPHDHIAFANNPPPKASDERYEQRHDWRKGIRDHSKITTGAATIKNAVAAAELRFIMSGLTSTASGGNAGSGAPGLARNIDSNSAQLEGLPITLAVSDTFPLGDTDGLQATTCAGFHPTRKTTSAIAGFHAYLPHIAEGVDDVAHAEFECQSDTFPGVPDPTHDLIQRQVAVVHGMAVNPNEVQQYQKDKAILIWSPRSNVSLYGNTAPIAEYAHMGVPITIGTDWLPSGSMNFARELKCADDLNTKYFGKALTDKQLWEGVTINAAIATGTSNTIGKLQKGWIADIAVFDASKSKDYRAVIEAGVEDTILVLRGGKVMYGDSELLGEMGENDCEDLPVCKVTKKVCANKDEAAGVKLADLQAAAKAVPYPLFYCKSETPMNEPTCDPKRGATASDDTASVYGGIVSGDKDGDGLKDADDNCPTVFNPIRPMDHGTQGDADGDGIGDACDKCPLEDGEGCTPPDANDIDGDGVANASDNCPKDDNKEQTDGDGDGKGAACDVCDDLANPGDSLCPFDLTISDVRDPSAPHHPPSGSHITLKGLVVTAVKTGMSGLGFYVQDPAATKFGGLFVFTSTAPSPAVVPGNKVDIEGDYTEFKGASEMSKPKITIVDPGTALTIAPIVVTADYNTGAQGEEIEGMLCTIDSELTVTQQNADPPPAMDFDEFIVKSASGLTNIWIDDYVFDALGNDYPVDKKFKKVVGICSTLDAQRKIFPRSLDDIPEVP